MSAIELKQVSIAPRRRRATMTIPCWKPEACPRNWECELPANILNDQCCSYIGEGDCRQKIFNHLTTHDCHKCVDEEVLRSDARNAKIAKMICEKIRPAPNYDEVDDLAKDLDLQLDSIFDEPAPPLKRGRVEGEVTYDGNSKRANSHGQAAPTVNVDKAAIVVDIQMLSQVMMRMSTSKVQAAMSPLRTTAKNYDP